MLLPFSSPFRQALVFTAAVLLLQVSVPHLHGQDFNAALETTGLTWTNRGWQVVTAGAHDGVDAATAGQPPLPGGGESFLGTSLAGPTPLAFWWKLAGGGPQESLSFEVDGVAQGPGLTGSTAWQRWEGALGAGSHQLRWRLTQSAGSTAAAVLDELLIGTPVPAGIASQPASVAVPLGGSAGFQVTAVGTPPLGYQWLKNGSPLDSATGTHLVISPVTVADGGGYSAIVTNPYGRATSEVATLTVLNLGILVPPLGVTRKVGENATFSVTAGGVPPFGYQWRKDGQPRAGATSSSLTLTAVQRSDVGAYDVVITNLHGSITSTVALLTINAALADGFNPQPDSSIFTLVPEPAGSVMLGGYFRFTTGRMLNRLDHDGIYRGDFISPIPAGGVQCVALRPDGTLLAAGGLWALVPGPIQALNAFVHLQADGPVLPTYQINNAVVINAIAPQADGGVVVGGGFSAINSTPRARLARFLPDGSLDPDFTPSADAAVYAVAVQADGRLLVGGEFTTLGGQPRQRLGRLTAAGGLDAGFAPGADGLVQCLLEQPDGKILVGGDFTLLGGQPHSRLGRLNADGSVDAGFHPELNAAVQTLALQADGKLLVGGQFTTVDGQERGRLARLHPDGTLDTSFDAGANDTVYSVALQDDGAVLVGGDFTQLSGESRTRAGRLLNPDAATQSVAWDGVTLTWLRSGAVPEVWRTEVEAWTGTGYTNVAAGARIAGGWQWTGLSLPVNTALRLRGHAKGGRYSASTWFSQAYAGPQMSTRQPLSRTNLAGTTATFTSGVVGAEPITYRWIKDGQPLADGPRISGAATPDLTLTGVLGGDAGGYALVASTSFGSVTSAVATLTVVDPILTSQPVDVATTVTSNAAFSVSAGGTAPLVYQWWKNGAPLADATASSLQFPNVTGGKAGNYVLVVSNAFGVVTSGVARLTVADPVLLAQPGNLSVPKGTNAAFSVTSLGTPPLVYEWFKDGLSVAGGTNATLVFEAAQTNDSGSYWVTVAGSFGSVTSSVATLVVWEAPQITSHPSSQSNYLGAPLTLSASASGSAPLKYQWRRNGGGIPGATRSTLAFASLAHADVASYDAVVTNAYGGVTSAPAAVVILNPYLLSQPTNRVGNLGQATTFMVGAGGLAPLEFQWRKGGLPIAGATASSLVLTNIQSGDAGNYDTVVTNPYGSVTSSVAALTFSSAVADGFNPGASGAVSAMLPLQDGKIMVAGDFQACAGVSRNRLARLNGDGTLDSGFNSGANSSVNSMAVQADGRILLGGHFTILAGSTRIRLGRLNTDGSLDVSFNPSVNNVVYALAVQPDGAILVAGNFTSVAGQTRTNLARLNADGTLDTNFTAGADGAIHALALQPDGSILVGGSFSRLAGEARANLGRLSNAGVADPNFDPVANGAVYALVLQPDGKVLVGGSFGQLGGQARANLGRLNPDGSVDGGFRADTDQPVFTASLLADGSFLVGGSFTQLAGQLRNRLGRLDANGALDPWFAAGANATVRCLAPEADGKVLVGGDFTTLAGQSRNYLGRLQLAGAAAQDATLNGATLQWTRSGMVPEVSHTIAEVWSGSAWTNLGSGTRVGSRWEWAVPPLPPTTTIRCQGRVTGGRYNGSGWWTAGFAGFPLVLDPVVSLDRVSGSTVNLSVRAMGSIPLNFQWLRNGVPLSNDARVSGATASQLTLMALNCTDAGAYAVVLSNYSGSVTSQVARLTVKDPSFALQPRSTAAPWGTNVTLTALAAGSGPFTYQWRRDGTNLANATATALVIENLQPAAACGYDVVVAGECGSVTSIVAHLNQELAGANGLGLGLVPRLDGGLLAAGNFSLAGNLSRMGLVRYRAGGSVDESLNLAADQMGYALAALPDGAVVIGGSFGSLGGLPRNRLARLLPDGAVDPGFDPNANGPVECLALQADGMILAGGTFTVVGGLSRNRIVRLYPDGSVDAGFNPGANAEVLNLTVQANGSILVGGLFTGLGGVARSYLGRLLPGGSVDPNFNPGANAQINAFAVQPDGRILVGGDFTAIGGATRVRFARLNSDGTVDLSFSADADVGSYPWVNSTVLQTDGKILVGGRFNALGGLARACLGRLNSDGTVDGTWNPGANSVVNGLAIQPDGRILVGGEFAALAGVPRNSIGRLDNTDRATSSLTVDGTTATWLRGGTGPEVWRTTFDAWTGSGWTNLGAGKYIGVGWQLGGLSLPGNATVRAQGFAVGGDDNCSTYIVEEGFGPPVISIAPVNWTNFLGTTASLSAWVVGSGPVSYRWRKGGVELSDGGSWSGTGTPNLSLANVQLADAGWYSVVATNALGSVTSAEVYLSVVPLSLNASGPGLGMSTNRQFSFQVGGGAAWPVSVEVSTNLNVWQSLTTPWVGPGAVTVTDAAATNHPGRIYRAKPVP